MKRSRSKKSGGKAQRGAKRVNLKPGKGAKASKHGEKSTYGGWRVPEVTASDNADCLLDRVTFGEITPREFWAKYIRCRRPCIIVGHPSAEQGWKGQQWTNEYLKQTVGSAPVRVEHRESVNESYGRGQEKVMPFAEFIELLDARNELHYLTTQDLEEDLDGRPLLMSAPCTQLRGDFPLQFPLGGNLALMNCNLWMGASRDGSASGLHHDYHDNFYLLLRGQKEFNLFSPADAPLMATNGRIYKVHPNGLINYYVEKNAKKERGTRPDGAHWDSMRASLAASEREKTPEEAEEALAEAEAAVARGDPGAEELLAAAEEALDNALMQTATAAAADEEDEDDDDDAPASAAPRRESMHSSQTSTKPPHFSQLKLPRDLQRLESQGAKPLTVTVNANEILYLPAGWFHNVTSRGTGSAGKAEPNVHMAFNYWFHPPSKLSVDDFEAPYEDDFWPSEFKKQLAALDS